MLERTIYFSGAGGTGKTRMISKLMEEFCDFIPANPDKLDRQNYDRAQRWEGYESDTYNYALGKIVNKHMREAMSCWQLEEKNRDKIILADRCVLDALSYCLAAERFGDLEEWQFRQVKNYVNSFSRDYMPKNVIFLDYPFFYTKKTLEDRGRREEKGLREDDEKYLKIVSESFHDFFEMYPPMLTVTDPEKGFEQVRDFLKKNYDLSRIYP